MAREHTVNDYKKRLNKVLIYIEQNLDSPLSLVNLARVACFSPFHFHRIFFAHVGETLNDYVRRIRMEQAALKLCHSGQPITSIALAAGYETPAAFTRAFKQHFGESPSDFKASKRLYLTKLLDPNSTASEVRKMKPEIRTLPDQKVIFVRSIGVYDKAAFKAWDTLTKFADSLRLIRKETRAIGITHDNPDITPEGKIRYDACLTINDKNIKTEGEVGIQTLSGGRYAVFLHKGPHNGLAAAYTEIFAQWLPASGKELRNTPHFEIYLNDPRKTKSNKLRTEICVPID